VGRGGVSCRHLCADGAPSLRLDVQSKGDVVTDDDGLRLLDGRLESEVGRATLRGRRGARYACAGPGGASSCARSQPGRNVGGSTARAACPFAMRAPCMQVNGWERQSRHTLPKGMSSSVKVRPPSMTGAGILLHASIAGVVMVRGVRSPRQHKKADGSIVGRGEIDPILGSGLFLDGPFSGDPRAPPSCSGRERELAAPHSPPLCPPPHSPAWWAFTARFGSQRPDPPTPQRKAPRVHPAVTNPLGRPGSLDTRCRQCPGR
jgi:hypothetical protein